MRMVVVSALSAVLVLEATAAADAGGIRVFINTPVVASGPVVVTPARPVTAAPSTVVVAPSSKVIAPGSTVVAPSSTVVAPFSNVFVSPRPVFVAPAPVFFVPSYSLARCRVPGYWSYQWVPQSYTYDVWVPGQWSPEGTWIDGHYEQRLYSTGYYQPIWIDDRYC